MSETLVMALVSLAGNLIVGVLGYYVNSRILAYRVGQIEARQEELERQIRRIPLMQKDLQLLERRLNERD